MKNTTALIAACALASLTSQAIAQQQTQLPGLTVETTKPAKRAQKKVSTKAATPKPAPPAEIQTPPPDVETALGPVKGLVATRSATGTKTDTPLLEVPRSVDVITTEQIAAQQPQSIRDAVAYSVGVQNQTGASSIRDVIAVRGFVAPIFLDGLLLPTDTGLGFARIRLEPYGLERLEILKGPASALFGQVPPGGLINAISKRPQDIPRNDVFVQTGTDNHREAGFDVTGPIGSPGELAYRLVG